MTQSWVNLTQFCGQLTKFWVTFGPELSMTSMDRFPGHIDAMFLLVQGHVHKI